MNLPRVLRCANEEAGFTLQRIAAWRGAASALVNPWPTDAAQGVVSIADPQPDSGSLALQATLQAVP
ncbi:MAG: hypothetical protein JOZ21_14170 [Verrucomicrobia bacterium]|nr:hypothetical protein [Verrucomicrobiota bacterium]